LTIVELNGRQFLETPLPTGVEWKPCGGELDLYEWAHEDLRAVVQAVQERHGIVWRDVAFSSPKNRWDTPGYSSKDYYPARPIHRDGTHPLSLKAHVIFIAHNGKFGPRTYQTRILDAPHTLKAMWNNRGHLEAPTPPVFEWQQKMFNRFVEAMEKRPEDVNPHYLAYWHHRLSKWPLKYFFGAFLKALSHYYDAIDEDPLVVENATTFNVDDSPNSVLGISNLNTWHWAQPVPNPDKGVTQEVFRKAFLAEDDDGVYKWLPSTPHVLHEPHL